MGTDNFQARDEETARAVLDAIRSVSEKTVIEFRMPRHWEGIDAENRALMMEELLRTIRDTVILNPLFTVRIVAASSAEKSQLTRALGKLSNRENQRFIAGKILIETARLSTLTPNTIVSDQAQSVLQEIQTSGKSETLVFDAGFYADGKTPIQFNQKVGPAQLFLATAAALSQKTVDGLSKLESMIKVQSEQALTSFALAIQLLVEQAEAASKVAEAA